MAFCCCEQDSEFWYMGNSIDTKVYHTPVFWYCPAFGPAGQQAPTKTPIIEEELKEFKIINRWAEYKGNWINPLGLWNEAYTSGNIIPEQLYGIWSRELTDQVPGITLSVGGGFVPVAPRLDLYNKTEIRASGILWRQNVSNRCLSTCPPPNPECINPTDPIIKQLCDMGDLENGRRVANIYFPIGSTMNPWETSPITDSTNQFPPPFEKWKRFVYTCLQNGSGTGDQDPELVWCPSGICRTAVCEQPGLSYCCETAWNSECAQAARNSIKCTYNGKDQGKAQHYLSPVGLTGPWPHFQPRVHHKTTEPIFTPARLFKTCDELCDTFKWQQEIDCTEKSYFGINKDIFTIEASPREWTNSISYQDWAGWTGRNFKEGCYTCIHYWNPEAWSTGNLCYRGITASSGPLTALEIYCTGGSLTEDKCNCVKNNVLLPGTTFTVNIQSNVNELISATRQSDNGCLVLTKNITKCKSCRVGVNQYWSSNYSYFDQWYDRTFYYSDYSDSTQLHGERVPATNVRYYYFNDNGYGSFFEDPSTNQYDNGNWGNRLWDHIDYDVIYKASDPHCPPPDTI